MRENISCARVIGYADSKNHPDCKRLRKQIFKTLGQKWIDAPLSEKEDFGKLWIPCLTKGDMNHLFGKIEQLRKIRDEVYDAVSYWEDVALYDPGQQIPDEKGELFFEPLEGYWLREMQ